MTLYDKYICGQTGEVYQDILALGQAVFLPTHFHDVDKILTETFQRVSYNLDIIYNELKNMGYLFKTKFKYNFERPLHKPLSDTNILLDRLDKAVKPFGYVPLSLKYFYKIVGGVNFAWDYETDDELMWQLADPIQVASLDAVVETVTGKYWQEEMKDIADEENVSYLELAADDLHKDNISGAGPYSLEVTRQPCVDSLFLTEPNNTTFINYLRICFDNCGFPGITRSNYDNDYQDFFNKVKPQLKTI